MTQSTQMNVDALTADIARQLGDSLISRYALRYGVGPVVAAQRVTGFCRTMFDRHPDELDERQRASLLDIIHRGDLPPEPGTVLTDSATDGARIDTDQDQCPSVHIRGKKQNGRPCAPPTGPASIARSAQEDHPMAASKTIDRPRRRSLKKRRTPKSGVRGQASGVSGNGSDHPTPDTRDPTPEIITTRTPPQVAADVSIDPPAAKHPGDLPGASSGIVIPVDQITPSPLNPRKHFDQADLLKLGESLRDDGQLQNCVVRARKDKRGHYQLVAGERRWRAAKAVKLPGIRCVVIEADDAKAVELMGLENEARAQFNAVEKARWYRAMLDTAGHTQAALARKIGVSQPLISQALALLDLPEAWQDRVITGVIQPSWARELSPWRDRPAVLDDVEKEVSRKRESWEGELDLEEFKVAIEAAVARHSRPLSGHFGFTDAKGTWRGGTVAFKPTGAQRAELAPVDVRFDGPKRQVTFNVELWEQLQADATSRKAERATGKHEKLERAATSAKSPKAKKAATANAKKQFAKRLHRWKTHWLQKQIVEKIPGATDAMLTHLLLHYATSGARGRSDKDIEAAITGKRKSPRGRGRYNVLSKLAGLDAKATRAVALAALRKWVAYPFDDWRSDLDAADVELIADALKIDLKRDWTLTRDYLELHTTAQLQDLAKQWKLTPAKMGITDGKRPATRTAWLDAIEKAKPKACPKELLTVKAPRR